MSSNEYGKRPEPREGCGLTLAVIALCAGTMLYLLFHAALAAGRWAAAG